jgi:predicted nucleic acid-binding protein
MGILTLDAIPDRAQVFVDAPIFIYHFTGLSRQCRRLLERCEAGAVRGFASVTVLAETTHRLMMIEAVNRRRGKAGNVARSLGGKPAVVKQLQRVCGQAAQIPLMGVTVLPLDLSLVLQAEEFRRTSGLLVNDSLIVATMKCAGLERIASADRDFARVAGLVLHGPTDLPRAH